MTLVVRRATATDASWLVEHVRALLAEPDVQTPLRPEEFVTTAEQQAGVVSILSDPAARRFALSGSHGTLVVSRTGAGALLVSNLGPAPSGKTYEAWVIQGKTPRRAGTFGQVKPFKLTRPVPQGAVVAVTLERHGGVNAPTTKPITAAQA